MRATIAGHSRTVAELIAASSIAAGLLTAPAHAAGAASIRNVFLNGVDISSAKSQELKNVDVVINERGDIFIVAPHYQVHEEDTYVPLSKFVQSMNAPQHKAPQPLAATMPTAGKLQPAMAVKVMPGSNPGAPDGEQPIGLTSGGMSTGETTQGGLAAKPGSKADAAAMQAESDSGASAAATAPETPPAAAKLPISDDAPDQGADE